jgi:HK97 family phage portal protein
MKIAEKLLAPFRRGGGGVSAAEESANLKRRTTALPAIFRSRTPENDALPKRTPENLRRFAELPIPRKAINTIKDRIAGMRWRVQARSGRAALAGDVAQRIEMLTKMFEHPNPDDSFRSLCEQVLEDVIVGGFGALELQPTGDAERPLQLWPVDGATVRLRADWNGDPSAIRYVQETRYGGMPLELADRELSYIRLNPRTHTPFGLGRLEVAFETIHAFLGAHRYAATLASNSVVQYALWMQELDAAQHERLIRWWQDEIEGTGKVPILTAETKPEVLRFGGGTDSDLRLQWQEFLIRVIAAAFDLPPLFLGVEADVNRSTAGELSSAAFRTAVVPTAKLLAEHLTRDVIGKALGFDDLEFVFADVDAPNELEQAQLHEVLLRSGVLTVDEVRAMRGMGPIGMAESKAKPRATDLH